MGSRERHSQSKKPTRDGKREHKDSWKEQLEVLSPTPKRAPLPEPKKPEKMEEGLSEAIWGPNR